MMAKLILYVVLLLKCSALAHGQVINDLFQKKENPGTDLRAIARDYQSLEINSQQLASLYERAPADLQIELPLKSERIKLKLQKAKIIADNFSVVEIVSATNRKAIEYDDGIFYQGTIEGKTRSIATISIFKDQVMGVIADEKGNLVLGAIQQNARAGKEYVLYRDTDLSIPNPFSCTMQDFSISHAETPITNNPASRITAVGEPVDIYIECDYQLYLDKGSSITNVINYTLGFFNSVALIFANENIHVQVSQIAVWSGIDPEAASLLTDGLAMLYSFYNRVGDNFNGDYAHFLTTRTNSGGGALVDAPCNSFPPKRYRAAVSGINPVYADFPVFSWTVYIVAHELGHNFGSQHSHWCGWPVGALDNCYDPEGACAGPPPVNGGTIMSYCTRSGNYINLANGFGYYPGNKIRSVIAGATCFGACRMTIETSTTDASCGLNNGSASVEVFDNTGNITYTWSNGHTGATISGIGPGVYHVTVKDATGCQVMQVVKIDNLGPVMDVQLSPNRTTGFCDGSAAILTATANNNYSYQWYRDGILIPGAVTNTYNAAVTGDYKVIVSQDFCEVTQTVKVLEVSPPQAEISPTGTIRFCNGNTNELNAYEGPGYFYQWYRDGTAINNAVDSVYSVQENGNYSVKVYAAGCESMAAPTSVIVDPSPTVNVTLSGNSSFCEGKNVTLFASTASNYTYQWQRNSVDVPGAVSPSYNTPLAGDFTVRTTLGPCAKTSAPVNVIVLPNPIITINPPVSTIPKFQTQTLTASGANTYNWAVLPDVISFTNNSAVFKPIATTTYSIEGLSSNGCKATAQATIFITGCGEIIDVSADVYSPSRVMIRWKNPPGTIADTLQYRKVGSSAWNQVFVTGESYELIGLEPNTSYEYNIIPLCVTSDGISSTTKTFVTSSLFTDNFIKVFPNPASNLAQLEVILNSPYTLEVMLYDGYGRKIKQVSPMQHLPAGQSIKQINTHALSSGVYYLLIIINGKEHSEKLRVIH